MRSGFLGSGRGRQAGSDDSDNHHNDARANDRDHNAGEEEDGDAFGLRGPRRERLRRQSKCYWRKEAHLKNGQDAQGALPDQAVRDQERADLMASPA